MHEVNRSVSNWKFRDIFNSMFNLSFHRPTKDSCKTCDLLKLKIEEAQKSGENEQSDQKKAEKELHLRKAEAAKEGYSKDCSNAREDSDVTTFCFDIQKTLPTPVLTTGLVYYKRQMWTYNMGIHDAKTNQGHMYCWNESQGSRGPNEVDLGLLKHIQQNPTGKHIKAYADTCGGQNCNIKMVVFWLYILQREDFNIETTD